MQKCENIIQYINNNNPDYNWEFDSDVTLSLDCN